MQSSRRSLAILLTVTILLLAVPGTLQAQTQPAAPSPQTTVDASKGGLTISSGVNSLTIGARVQVRWTLEDREAGDNDTEGAGVGKEDGPLTSFDIPRMRVTLSGGMWRAWLKYTFQFDFSRTSGEGSSKIKDAFIEIRPVDRPYRAQFGQFKAPFGLQQLTSSGRLQFVDRAITDAKFNPARDMGAMFSGTAAGRKFGYDASIFNGSGESIRQTTEAPLLVGRVYVQPLAPYVLAESSVDAPEHPQLLLGLAARTGKQIRGRTTTGILEDADDETALNGEFAYKDSRFFSTAEFFWMTDEQENPVLGPDVDSWGFHAQAGYMLKPRQLEAAVLFSQITPDTDVDDAEVNELRGVVGYYWQAHNLKLQADIGRLGFGSNFRALSARARQGLPTLGPRLVTGESLNDTQLRVQLQLAF